MKCTGEGTHKLGSICQNFMPDLLEASLVLDPVVERTDHELMLGSKEDEGMRAAMEALFTKTAQYQIDTPNTMARLCSVPEEDQDVFRGLFFWTPFLTQALETYWGHSDFRGHQLPVINAIFKRKNVFLVMPTGGGKSLTYQLPVLAVPMGLRCLAIVVCPLLSLVQDQMENLANLGVYAAALNSETPAEEREQIFKDLANYGPNSPRFLYLTPEKLVHAFKKENALFGILKTLREKQILRYVCIDEAHCISQWGPDFRQEYSELGIVRQKLGLQVVAVTASADEKVVEDACKSLKIPEALIFKQSFDRPNLFLEVRPKSSGCSAEIADFLTQGHCGIVYVLSRKECHTMADSLNRHMQVGKAAAYHAALPAEEKQMIQLAWKRGTITVICATLAFGMGIDYAHVRFVFHYCIPPSMERLYQEIGRAGRDTQPSRCIIYYSSNDFSRVTELQSDKKSNPEKTKKQLDEIKQFCETTTVCRRKLLLQAFGQTLKEGQCQGSCDVCWKEQYEGGSGAAQLVDITPTMITVQNLIRDNPRAGATVAKLRDMLKGKNVKAPFGAAIFNNHAGRGQCAVWKPDQIEGVIRKMIENGFLRELEKKSKEGRIWKSLTNGFKTVNICDKHEIYMYLPVKKTVKKTPKAAASKPKTPAKAKAKAPKAQPKIQKAPPLLHPAVPKATNAFREYAEEPDPWEIVTMYDCESVRNRELPEKYGNRF